MIASWMTYALAVSALVTIATMAVDRVLGARGLPRRFAWAGAMAASMVWPIVHVLNRAVPSARPAELLPFTVTIPGPTTIATRVDLSVLIDRLLLIAWITVTILLLVRMVRAMAVLRRSRDAWARAEIDGTVVRVASNVGPALVGLRHMDVVVPEWIWTLDASLRAIVLRHEQEHAQARDPYFLFGGAMGVALMPWNLPLWVQWRRLRLAVELDCDARVLRVHPSPERYGRLMVAMAQRRSLAPVQFAPMLIETTTQLERRIIAMRSTTRRLARLTIVGGSLVAVSALVFACSLQSDDPTSPRPAPAKANAKAGPTYFEFQVSKQVSPAPGNVAPRYPNLLRNQGLEGEVLAQFVVDRDGRADMNTFKVLKSTHELFTAAVRASLPAMQFIPAEVNGHLVKQLVQMPFQFNLSHTNEVAAVSMQAAASMAPRRDTITVRRLAAVRATISEGEGPSHVSANANLRDYQVENAAKPAPGNRAPRYPDALRKARVEGDVLVQFVVDSSGGVELSTFKVLRSADPAFTQAVRDALATYRFTPAEVGGMHVKQLVTMPFTFDLSKQ